MTFQRLPRPALLLCVMILITCSATAWAHGIHADQVRALSRGGPFEYFKAGAIHMLTGYDHLLFLFGVMFFLTNLKDIAKFITAFTIGHSITLIAATLYGVQANYFLIDAVIAISVLYKGFDNLDSFRHWFGIAPPNLPQHCRWIAHAAPTSRRWPRSHQTPRPVSSHHQQPSPPRAHADRENMLAPCRLASAQYTA